MLDAEFALILFDGSTGEYIAARDPIGIRPLYYGYDSKGTILFASEPRGAWWACARPHSALSSRGISIRTENLSATGI